MDVGGASQAQSFSSSLDHLLAALERIDLLVQLQVRRARQLHAGDPEFQGLCITEPEVDALLAKPCGLPRWAEPNALPGVAAVHTASERLQASLDERKRASLAAGVRLRLEELSERFELTPLDRDIVLVCLAPEMDLRYEKLFAYLQDDVTRKRPSIDLVLNLLCRSFPEKIDARRRFAAGATLIDHEIVQLLIDPAQPEPTRLRQGCKLDERIVSFLLGFDELDVRLRSTVTVKTSLAPLDALQLPRELKERLGTLGRSIALNGERTVFYFQGPSGVGKSSAAQALGREFGLALLAVDIKQLLEDATPGFQPGVQLALREARLQHTALYWFGFDRLLQEDKAGALKWLLRHLETGPSLTFLAGEATWEPAADQLGGSSFFRVQFPSLDDAERLALWERLLPCAGRAADVDLSLVSSRFRLNTGSIKAAVRSARNLACWRDPPSALVTMNDLYAACQVQSNRKLATLARQIKPKYVWEDLVLPPDELSQLRELLDQARHRHMVYGRWGFDRKLSLGKGLNALFSGPPGTGKTMAAEIIASELHLDLYKIDLSQVVSKYIGETEKNLDQIFREAQGSNAILFFDEADALFGKRSDVKDAHDRYANIEIGYLLQKMEEYEGIAILATNLRQNLDEAFVRRLHVIIEFPFPDEEHRRRLWQIAFPHEAPRSDDIDFAALARDIRLAGGNIKNIVLAAAFYAASDGKVIRMPHLMQAAHREHQKLGRTWIESDRRLEKATSIAQPRNQHAA